jgi:hypothetical protein
MILVSGAVRRSFTFPADISSAFGYFARFEKIIALLPHIRLTKAYGDHVYRMRYHTVELGIYQVQITCDLKVDIDSEAKLLRVRPYRAAAPVRPQAGMYTINAQGIYESESMFSVRGQQTEVLYSLRIEAVLPVPLAIQLVPGSLRNRIAQAITHRRMREIADGFVTRSIVDYGDGGCMEADTKSRSKV